MAVKNSTILASAWLEGTNDFQQNIPDPTITAMSEVNKALFDPMNSNLFNQWSAGLINRIGMTIAEQKRFENPLAIFRKPDMGFGFTVQQIAVKWAKTHSYKDNDESLLKYERPEFMSAFHSVDRWDKYKVSITRPEIRQALADGESFGLNNLIDMAVSSCTNKEAYDEMNIMINELAIHDTNHGIFRHKLSAEPTDKATSQELLAAVKTYVNRFRFPSTLYNAQDVDGIPTFAKESECVILVTPDVMANLDVYAFAELFNVDRAEVRARVVMVPEFPWPNVPAVLTTEDIFVCARTEFGMYPFFDNNTLTTHNVLHAQGIYSVNPFCPCVMFTTEEDTLVHSIKQTVEGVEITAADGKNTVSAGDAKQLVVKLTGSIAPGGMGAELAPDAVTWSVACEAANGDPVKLNARTYVDRFAVLHVQKSDIEAGMKLHVTGETAYIDPSKPGSQRETYTKTIELTIE